MRSSQRVWHPLRTETLRNMKCFVSSVRLQTDFGEATPSQRPRGSLLPFYITEPAEKKGTFWRYMRSAREEAPFIAAAVFGVGLYSASTLAIPAGFGELIDFASRGDMPLGTSMRLLGLFTLAGIGNFIRLALIGYAGERVIARLRCRLYRGFLSQPTSFFDLRENSSGSLVQRLTMDCNVVGSSLTEAVTQGSKNILQTIGSIGIMLYYSPTLTGVICGIIPFLALYAGVYGRYVRKLQQQMQDAIAEKGTVAAERLGNICTVKAFAREAEELNWYQKKVYNVFDISKHMLFYNASYASSLQFLGYGALYCIMWAGSMLVASNNLSPGVLFSFMLYTVYCGIGLMGLTNLVTEINKGYGASIRIYDVLDKEELFQESQKEKSMIIPKQCKWEIKFNNVCFAYPTRPEAPVYEKLNLEILPSRCTCIVGSSGCGKSSLALLLLKLYAPTGGSITIDGYELQNLDTQWLCGKIGYVGQEPVLFGGTIAQNIAYGALDRKWDEEIDQWQHSSIVYAAMQANAHEFISALPSGYDTFVGEGGRSLSGGQKQRIAIARALLRRPRILILDEATSALDSESEVVVHEAISRLIEDAKSVKERRTVLMFAHKLSMIRKADHIVVLDKGSVTVQGSFDKVKTDRLFRQIVGLSSDAMLEEDGGVVAGECSNEK